MLHPTRRLATLPSMNVERRGDHNFTVFCRREGAEWRCEAAYDMQSRKARYELRLKLGQARLGCTA